MEVTGAVDHGIIWSIYFFDPNNIPLEASWDCMEMLGAPAIHDDDDPLAVTGEGADPQPGVWPQVTAPTPPEQMVANGGNGFAMRADFLARGLARAKPELTQALRAMAAE